MIRGATASGECPSAERVLAVAGGIVDEAVTLHAETCRECRAILVELRQGLCETEGETSPARPPPVLAAGSTVDRFVIERRLGAGAMGVVYAAHDPKLSRSIALKVVRPERAVDELLPRFEREAVAAAQVSHPNVVAVYDVGQQGEQIFIAMELVRGVTLRGWLAVPHPWREVMAKLLEAARGLAAIHAAGLVHRDFKPDNVLIGEDGRARVSDFGLARTPTGPTTSESPSPISSSLTQTGAFVGTPAYAAPEQLRGDVIDVHSDQFAFAVTAWEALYGARPFSGGTIAEMRAQMGGALPAPRSEVPTGVARVLRRALSVRATDRYPTIAEVAADLEHACRRRRWPYLIMAGLALGGSVSAVAALWPSPPEQTDPCREVTQPIGGVWDPTVRLRLTTQFIQSGHPQAQRLAAMATEKIDQRATDWVRSSRSVCSDRQLGLVSQETTTLRTSCLVDRLTELRLFLRELANADEQTVERAPRAAARLGDPSSCQLQREGAILAPAAAALGTEIAQLETTLELRGVTVARARLDELRRRVKALGDPALDADLAFVSGLVAYNGGQSTLAIDELRSAIVIAERTRRDSVRAQASISLANALVDRRELDEAERVLEQAQATIQRVGGDPMLEVMRSVAFARLLHTRGEPARALEVLARISLAAVRDTQQHSEILMLRADVLRSLGRGAEAVASLAEAVSVFERVYGQRRSLSVLTSEVQQALVAGEFQRAVQLGERALASATPGDVETVTIRRMIYFSLAMLGRHAEAREQARSTLALAVDAKAKLEIATAHGDIGLMSLDLGDAVQAVADFRAGAAVAAELGPDGAEASLDAHTGLGEALAAAGAFEEAIAELERLLPLYERAQPARPNFVANLQFGLAQALWRRNRAGDRDRARSAVEVAIAQMRAHRATFQANDPLGLAFMERDDRLVRRFEAWRAAH